MKQFLQILFLFSVIICLIGCDTSVSRSGTLVEYVPEGVSVVFKIRNFETLQADLKNSSLISEFGKTTPHTFFSEKSQLLKYLKPTSESLLCVSVEKDSSAAFTFITKYSKTLLVTDSIKNKSVETLFFKNSEIQRVVIENEIAFTAIVDSVFIASSSQKILQEILEGKTEKSETFQKVYALPHSGGLTSLLRSPPVKTDSVSNNFASWASVDVAVLPNQISGTGIVLARDTIPQLLNVFEGQAPQLNGIAQITPTQAIGVLSFTFNDSEKIQKNLRAFRGEKGEFITTGIFGSVNEIGIIELPQSKAVVLKSIDASLTMEALGRFISSSSSFRETEIFNFNEPSLFTETFYPLIPKTKLGTMFQLDNFFVFTENETVAQQMIAAYKNNATLENTAFFEDYKSSLSDASSLLILKMNGDSNQALSGFFDSGIASEVNGISFKNYPLAALQFSYDRDFAHLNFVCKESSNAARTTATVSEALNIKLENTILGSPVFFSNSSSGGKDIVVQDLANILYYISGSGKILWQKKLDGPILGKIEEVDFFKNGNTQMAFATKKNFHVFDRTGKNVSPFPLNFKDEITRPLAVFDYDNNSDYRFIIIQGKDVLMYDKQGKTVSGFTFKKAKSNIVQSPKHIRIGNRDYILIAEENGKLNILNRVGSSRLNVEKNFQFSEIPIAKEENTFVVVTSENTKERIDENGKVSSQKLDVSTNYWFEVQGNIKVTFDDNILRINGKPIELPLGVYGKPSLTTTNRKLYISITETQENKVYVFDDKGAVLPGFPIYGTSSAHISNASNGKIKLTVQGETDTVLVYQME